MLLLYQLTHETQISKPPEATRHHNSIKLLILLPLRAIYFSTFQYETPCKLEFSECFSLFQLKVKGSIKEVNKKITIGKKSQKCKKILYLAQKVLLRASSLLVFFVLIW